MGLLAKKRAAQEILQDKWLYVPLAGEAAGVNLSAMGPRNESMV